jgi:tetratricopeptide (TPR) repeat protein
MTLAYLHAEKGDAVEVAAVCQRGLALGREAGIAYYSSRLTSCLGYVKALSGSIDEGIGLLRNGLRDHEAMGLRTQVSRLSVYLAKGLVLSGRLDEAEVDACRAYTLATAGGERWEEAMARQLLGDIVVLRNPESGGVASTHYEAALSIATAIGARPLVAHCHLSLGRLYQRTGREERAYEHLTVATTMYREMGMTYWLEKAEAELK